MFVHATTIEGKRIAINPMTIAVIVERETDRTAIETTDGNEYIVAESFTDFKVKLESSINKYRQHSTSLRSL